MQIPCVYVPGPAPAVSVANRNHCFRMVGFDRILLQDSLYQNTAAGSKQRENLSSVEPIYSLVLAVKKIK